MIKVTYCIRQQGLDERPCSWTPGPEVPPTLSCLSLRNYTTHTSTFTLSKCRAFTLPKRGFSGMALKKENWGRAFFAFDYEPFLMRGWKKVDYSRNFFSPLFYSQTHHLQSHSRIRCPAVWQSQGTGGWLGFQSSLSSTPIREITILSHRSSQVKNGLQDAWTMKSSLACSVKEKPSEPLH